MGLLQAMGHACCKLQLGSLGLLPRHAIVMPAGIAMTADVGLSQLPEAEGGGSP